VKVAVLTPENEATDRLLGRIHTHYTTRPSGPLRQRLRGEPVRSLLLLTATLVPRAGRA
jgi:hypothetical protein